MKECIITEIDDSCPYESISGRTCFKCKLIDYKNHYQFLDNHFAKFVNKLDLPQFKDLSSNELKEFCNSWIKAHGDKAYGYKNAWEKEGIHFYHGVAIYLLTYERPFSYEVRETKDGWVDPWKWVIRNKENNFYVK